MAGRETIDREVLINTIWQCDGKISDVAAAMGCSVKTIYNYVDRWQTVRDAVDGARVGWKEKLVDKAEHGLANKLDAEHWLAIRYALDTLGQDRGYGSRIILAGDEDAQIPVRVVDYRDGLAQIAPRSVGDSPGSS